MTSEEVLTAARTAFGARAVELSLGADGLLSVARGGYRQVLDVNQLGSPSALNDALGFCVLAFDREAPPA